MSQSIHPKVHAANGLQDFIAISRYARYLPEKRRRETWTEAVRRVRDMHLAHYPDPPLAPAIWGPIEETAAEIFPGLPVVPIFQAGGTDAPFLAAIGIPTYGIGAYFLDPDLGHIHGLNERIGVDSLYEARDFLHALVKRLATAPDPIP